MLCDMIERSDDNELKRPSTENKVSELIELAGVPDVLFINVETLMGEHGLLVERQARLSEQEIEKRKLIVVLLGDVGEGGYEDEEKGLGSWTDCRGVWWRRRL